MLDQVVVGALAVLQELVARVLPGREQRNGSPERRGRVGALALLGAESPVLVLGLLDEPGGRRGVGAGLRGRRCGRKDSDGENDGGADDDRVSPCA
jgi:hypothetical protein